MEPLFLPSYALFVLFDLLFFIISYVGHLHFVFTPQFMTSDGPLWNCVLYLGDFVAPPNISAAPFPISSLPFPRLPGDWEEGLPYLLKEDHARRRNTFPLLFRPHSLPLCPFPSLHYYRTLPFPIVYPLSPLTWQWCRPCPCCPLALLTFFSLCTATFHTFVLVYMVSHIFTAFQDPHSSFILFYMPRSPFYTDHLHLFYFSLHTPHTPG